MPDRIASTFASRFRRPVLDFDPPAAERPRRLRRLWSILPIGVAFGLFGAVVWLAYQDVGLGPPTGEPPLIKAAAEPLKLRPDEADDSALAAEQGTVGRLWSDADQLDRPERLLPGPEAPLSPPSLEEPATAAQPAQQPAAEGGAPETAAAAPQTAGEQEGEVGVAAAPAAPTGPAPPASDESVREAEAALDRLLAEVTAMSGGTNAPAAPAGGQAAAQSRPEQSASAAREQPASTASEQPASAASEPNPPVASAPRSAAPAAPAVPENPAPPPQPQVRPAAAPTAPPAPAPQPAERPTETAALTGNALRSQIAPGGGFRIQLAAVRGEADAQRAWEMFLADLGPVLAGVQPIFERADTANGVFYRVQVGPFASEDAAERLCEQLKQRNASCFVISR